MVAVLGPNGAGKTTLLRALAGPAPCRRGHVRLDGDVLDDAAAGVHALPERRPIGVVFQDYLLFPHLSARDNVAFGLRAAAGSRSARRAGRPESGSSASGCRSTPSASRGRCREVRPSGSRWPVRWPPTPRLLLLDEPLAALDAGSRAEVRRELRRHLAEFRGVRVIVTHDPVDAATLADRLVVVEAGRVSQSGTVSEVSAHPRSEYVAELVGLNLYRGRATRGSIAVGHGAALETGDTSLQGDVFAVVNPRAVALFVDEPHGSPRNRWRGTVTDLDVLADRVRVRLEGAVTVVAEVTTAAADELGVARRPRALERGEGDRRPGVSRLSGRPCGRGCRAWRAAPAPT